MQCYLLCLVGFKALYCSKRYIRLQVDPFYVRGSWSYMCANFWSFFYLNVGDGALGQNLVPIAKELCKKLTYPLFDY